MNGCNRLLRKITFAVICALFLTACASRQIEWDEKFIQYFEPDALTQKALAHCIRAVNKEVKVGNRTVRLTQTLGDEKTVYLAVDIIIPGVTKGDASIDTAALPENLYLFSGPIAQEQIEGMRMEAICKTYRADAYYVNTSVYFLSNKEDVFSYIFCMDVMDARKIEGDLTLIMDGISGMASEPFLISWNAGRAAAAPSYEIYREGEKQGTLKVSNFAIRIDLDGSKYQSFDDVLNDIIIQDTLGNVRKLDGPVGGSFSKETGACTVNCMYNDLSFFETIEAVQIGAIKVEIKQ